VNEDNQEAESEEGEEYSPHVSGTALMETAVEEEVSFPFELDLGGPFVEQSSDPSREVSTPPPVINNNFNITDLFVVHGVIIRDG
jgi:hypothetical protein